MQVCHYLRNFSIYIFRRVVFNIANAMLYEQYEKYKTIVGIKFADTSRICIEHTFN